MAFKLESISKMTDICNKLVSSVDTAESITNNITADIDTLVNSISGKGVDKSLSNLRNAVSNESKLMIELLSDLEAFIRSQTENYAINEENVSAALADIQSALDSIVIN